jgi:DNA-binding Xre family transcriptional regulator
MPLSIGWLKKFSGREQSAFTHFNSLFTEKILTSKIGTCIMIFSPEREVLTMAVSYKKLWKLLIDKDMKKKDLRQATGMSTTSLAKLSKNENINTEILVKICKVLECDIGDIMEVIEE